jgi:hypothetical protein
MGVAIPLIMLAIIIFDYFRELLSESLQQYKMEEWEFFL